MPKKDYNPTHAPVTSESRPERIPLFKRPYDGGRITALEDDVRDIFDRLDGVEDRFDGLDDRLEEILRACQGAKKEAPVSKAPEEPKPEPVKAVKQPEPAPEPNPEPKLEPVKVVKQPEPVPEPKPESKPQPASTKEGWPRVGYAYIWWDADNRVWVPSTNIWAAKQAGNGVYHPKWAWLDEQHRLVRFLTKEEIMRYCP